MKIPIGNLSVLNMLEEFDVWITPSLGEVKASDRFKEEMERVTGVLDAIGAATNDFAEVEDCKPSAIADTLMQIIKGQPQDNARFQLMALAAVLFLVTGKSDNNSKCQFPLHLRESARWDNLPKIPNRKSKSVVFEKIPRILKAEDYMRRVASLAEYPDHQKRLLQEFINFILNDESCLSQIWSIGHSYFKLKPIKKELALLTPLVAFQVRGSVSASGGHEPERLLRKRLDEWGLRKNIDYNITDVNLTEALEIRPASDRQPKYKRRAYDFVIPYQTPNWKDPWAQRIFIQCQFYAGDSGSVSHKNLDQTKASRQSVIQSLPDARFVEYLDGAGYFSALNGDLKKMLEMPTTSSFFQVRSAAIRLRRELQQLGFLVPLDLEHAIFCSDRTLAGVRRWLTEEGYNSQEINRCLEDCIERGLVLVQDDSLSLSLKRRTIARRYFLLDVVARCGESSALATEKLSGSLMVPGYGAFYGMKLDFLVSEALSLAASLREDWVEPTVFPRDIRWLCDEGLAMSR